MGQAASQMAASGGCIRMYACILKQHALLEQMIVEGIKASCVVLVASRVPGEEEEEVLLMRRGRTRRSVRAA